MKQSLTFVFGTWLALCAAAAHATPEDQHSVETIAEALASPVPAAAVEEARAFDDQLLGTGMYGGVKIYLVTDDRSQHVQQLVTRLLAAMNQDSAGWVVRILDTTPKIPNAFVAGGKYVYVFTGILDEAKSEDEIAFVVGHELGHTLLKHSSRKRNDISSTLAALATIIAAATRGEAQQNARQVAEVIKNSYSQVDESEADTFGVLAAWRGGFDPLRGVDFFTRLERAEDEATGDRDKDLENYRQQVLQQQAECESLTEQWNNGQIAQSKKNAQEIDQRCAAADQQAGAYNAALTRAQQEDAQRQSARRAGDHPDPQARIASVAALTDYVHGVRPFESLSPYPPAKRVITALVKIDSPLLKPIATVGKSKSAP